MKFASLLLTLVVLLLNSVPCCAWEAADEQHTDECKNCSPFYACGNCSATLEIPSMAYVSHQTQSILPVTNTIFIFSYTKGIANDVWQPPQLS